ncbi:DeoR/GlpR family transcriptional regulator [Agaribacter marinus]|uniref:DeoR/GlpR family transcriptional regulator n=1 Tax=Agaribacter marinus TaxID=1431249 RepID=A0AA37WJH4_9ALTE|nr:DeoR/GlpR family transcriptional regulator [Agaribacter marinus]GLR70204.1 DeoR/GlpR family transcriptional regulator [Agaribacter marinus]
MAQERRQDGILTLVKDKGFVSIDDLVAHFNVTPQTIRRDLNQLANENKVRRHHGGAGTVSSVTNTEYTKRKIMDSVAKEKIAAHVATMIPDGSSVFINIGTTTETVARALLQHQNLRVVTNNLHVASILAVKEDFTVLIAAGEVRHRDGGIIGEATEDFISQFKMDFGIIGISGIDEDGSLLDFDFREVRVAQSIIRNSRRVILGADGSKFGRFAMVKLGNINQAHDFVTDTQPPHSISELLKASEVNLHIV